MNEKGPTDFPTFLRSVRERYSAALRSGNGRQPELPFCLDDGGRTIDAMRQLRGTLAGFFAIVFAVAAGITAIFTLGVVLWVLLGICAVALLAWLVLGTALRAAGRRWRSEATPFPAAFVMAHGSVLQPGNSIVPGTLLVDFGANPDPDRLVAAGQAAGELGGREDLPAALVPVRQWLQTEMQRARFGRIRLPKEIAGSDDCWLVSLRFDRASMPKGFVDRPLWFVLARHGRMESAELLPHEHWVAAG